MPSRLLQRGAPCRLRRPLWHNAPTGRKWSAENLCGNTAQNGRMASRRGRGQTNRTFTAGLATHLSEVRQPRVNCDKINYFRYLKTSKLKP